jgi:hypothetical protein
MILIAQGLAARRSTTGEVTTMGWMQGSGGAGARYGFLGGVSSRGRLLCARSDRLPRWLSAHARVLMRRTARAASPVASSRAVVGSGTTCPG